MFNLIVIVVTLGLVAALTAATLNYVPLDAQMRQQMYKEADRGIKALECAVTRYMDAQRSVAGGPIDMVPASGNLVSAVTPSYGFLPADVRKEMTWDINAGSVSSMPAVGICLRPIIKSSAMQREVLTKLQSQLPVGSTFVSTGCNATADTVNGGYLTYWIPLAHVN